MGLDKILPLELVYKIYEYTDFKTIIIQKPYNYNYLLNKLCKIDVDLINSIGYLINPKFSKFNYNHKNDIIKNKNYTLTKDKIPCVYKNNVNEIELIINSNRNIYFNNLELRNLKLDNLISISLQIGGCEINKIYRDSFITLNEFFKISSSKGVPLPFIFDKMLMYNLLYHEIKLIFKFLPGKTYGSTMIALYSDIYNIRNEINHENENESTVYYENKRRLIKPYKFFNEKIINSYTNKILEFNTEKVDKLEIKGINIPVYAFFITGNFNKNEILFFTLELYNKIVIQITPDQLNKRNNNMGYNFDNPTFIFSNELNKYTKNIVNFSGKYPVLCIHYRNTSCDKYHSNDNYIKNYNYNYNINFITLNKLIITQGMGGLVFCN